MAYTHPANEPVAIIGSGCRFPGDASSPSKLWNLLRDPRHVSKRVPERSFNPDGFYHPNGEHHGASNVAKSYFLEEDPRLFDSGFFNTTPREAEAIDPQQRLLLETVYEAMESSGLTMKGLKGTATSAYVGLMTADYTDTQARDTENFSQYMATGTSRSLISNRLSYFFDWNGPSMTVDTACSSSLTAVHLAVQSLRSGESKVACAAGANLLLGPDLFIGASSLHMISPSGRSQMWDVGADGYARGEGIAAVFLKTLSQAIKDGDHIEAIIRETGVNSDGRTKGITLPSPEAQAILIKETYKKSGLDISKLEDLPQYFEAHGTGTQAGDPREAQAISQSFFGQDNEALANHKLFVGSIKTIIGHTEGCAGIAGLLKATLAMQNRLIPPNQHFNTLNPSVAVSYKNLEVPTSLKPWPSVPPGHPFRSSINSFGFGGTNAHAIIETYEPAIHAEGPWARETVHAPPSNTLNTLDVQSIPLLFSAHSPKALLSIVERYSVYLKENEINFADLAWTLQSRRSALPVKAFFSGIDKRDIINKIDSQLNTLRETPGIEFGTRSKPLDKGEQIRILGVFTGQGAQWATMGKDLILNSPAFSRSIDAMEESLDQLPDGPDWSLKAEIIAPPQKSRLNEASLSQPLCTALQVALVDLLFSAGITFHTVVGHSSGEIAAAYAAGRLSARDAIRIAYYRGVHAKLARAENMAKGSMIAVGLSLDEAKDFCAKPQMKDRLTVAASNAPGSVTLSGDEDAVNEAKLSLDSDGVFARVLKVDTAYHSHHMKPCAEPYLASLEACKIKINAPNDTCIWVSSVYGLFGEPSLDELEGPYWRDNMVQAVLFSQAIERALDTNRPFDVILEVGPHPALKGPALQTIKSILGRNIDYFGVLDRKQNDVVAFGQALGSLWANFGPGIVDFSTYAATFHACKVQHPLPLKGLPTYPWEHNQILWKESRINKQFRSRPEPPHELLGTRTPDDTPHEPRWRNYLKLEEMPWLKDHRFQGQIVIPGAFYCVMALEASKALSAGKAVQIVELQNVIIHRAISMDDDSEGTETLFSLKRIDTDVQNLKNDSSSEVIKAEFNLSAITSEEKNGTMRKICSGEVYVYIGEEHSVDFPERTKTKSELNSVSINRFYTSMADIGLTYTGAFRGLANAQRRFNMASCIVDKQDFAPSLPVHPTWLDVSFQTLFVAFASPGDTTLWTTFLPKTIRRIRVAESVILKEASSTLEIESCLTELTPPSGASLPTITGDINIFNARTGKMGIQIEELSMSSFIGATEEEDRRLFLENVWIPDIKSGPLKHDNQDTRSSLNLAIIRAAERIAFYYLRQFKSSAVPRDSPEKEAIEAFASNVLSMKNKNYPFDAVDWIKDSRADIQHLVEKFKGSIDIELVRAVGETLIAETQGKSSVSQSIVGKEMFHRWLKDGLGLSKSKKNLARAAKQIAHRYPHMRILEFGAGLESSIDSVITELGSSFSSYTVADLAPEDLDKARERFSQNPKVDFKQVDLEQALWNQDFREHSFDLLIASNILHTVSDSQGVLEGMRKLLKPGGYLLILEPGNELLRFNFIMTTQGKWLPRVGNGALVSTKSPVQWDKQLRGSGFSGVASIVHDSNNARISTFNTIISQATDETIRMIQTPLSSEASGFLSGNILLVGGKTLPTSKLIANFSSLLPNWRGSVLTADSFESLDLDNFPPIRALVSLADLDSPIIKDLDAESFKNIQQVFRNVRTVLWVTSGATNDNPYHSATIGLGRSIKSESPLLQLQFLDIDDVSGAETMVAEHLLRLLIADLPEFKNKSHLWTTETELSIKNGKLLIPRLLPLSKLNDRLNSARRVISKSVNTSDTPVEIVASGTIQTPQYEARESILLQPYHGFNDPLTINVKFSTLNPVVVGYSRLFLCIGSIAEDQRLVLALAPSNTSIVIVPREWSMILDVSFDFGPHHLSEIANYIHAQTITDTMPLGSTTVLFEPEDRLVTAIKSLTSGSKHKFVLLTSTLKKSSYAHSWIEIHPRTSKLAIKSLLPTKLGLFLNLSTSSIDDIPALREFLPASFNTSSFFQLQPDFDIDFQVSFQSTLSMALQYLNSQLLHNAKVTYTHPLSGSQVVTTPLLPPATIVDWASTKNISVVQSPIDPSLLFADNKSYLLVGLTGQLGQSVCRWMVENGARYIVVSSRNPDLDPIWRDELEISGATIRIEPMDVTDKSDLLRVYHDLSRSFPPIAGVANGAMVLADGLFNDMSFESMQKVLKPKVDGTKNLDEVFYSQDLDFFLLFSSLSAVVGMPGQANYAAANMFMTGIAAQRQKRGVTASVIDIGMILGIGYIQRTEGDEGNGIVEVSLRKQNYLPIAERDIHQILAEGILAGRVGSGLQSNIITGLQQLDLSSTSLPLWHDIPRFSHHVNENHVFVEEAEGAAKSVRQQLASAKSAEEAIEALEVSFTAQLVSMLKLPSDGVNVNIPIIDFGIDSLVAVEIRTWFLKEADQDVPILKILGGSSIRQVCTDATSSMTFDSKSIEPIIEANIISEKFISATKPMRKSDSVESSSSTHSSPFSAPNLDTPISSAGSVSGELTKLDRPIAYQTENMSFGQSRIYLPSLFLEDKTVYNCTISYRFAGPVSITRLENALQLVTQRHEAFRSSFYVDPLSGSPTQSISETSRFSLKKIPLANDTSDVKEEFRRIHNYVYDLEAGDTFISTILSHEVNSHTIIFGYHHIIMDGVSWQVFLRDFGLLYAKVPPNLPAETTYLEFTKKQKIQSASGAYSDRLEFFAKEFPEPPAPLPLFPFAKTSTRKPLTRYDTLDIVIDIEPRLVSQIKKASLATRTTAFHFWLSTFQVLLHRFLDIDQMCIGIVDANRSDQTFMNTVGFLLELLPVNFKVKKHQKFSEILQQTRLKAYASLAHTGVPIEEIIRKLNIPASTLNTPLFQVIFNYRMGATRTGDMHDTKLTFLEYEDARTPFDLAISVDEKDDGSGMLTFSMLDYLYDREGADLLVKTYVHLLDVLSRDTSITLDKVPLFDQSQIDRAITLGTGPVLDFQLSETITLSHQFDSWVKEDPNAVAVKDLNGKMRTYLETSERANAIASALIDADATPGSYISVLCESTAETIAYILAILRIGAVYVPLDVRNADERLNDILEESAAEFLLYHTVTARRLSNLRTDSAKKLNIDEIPESVSGVIPNVSVPDLPAFLLHTSGTTGKPKGIILTNLNLSSNVAAVTQNLNLGREVFLQQSGLGFDASIAQIFYTLANGGTLIIGDNRGDPAELSALMLREKVTATLFIISELSAILNYGVEALSKCKSWRLSLCGGEAFTSNILEKFRRLNLPELRVVNAYGPTEASIICSIGEVFYNDLQRYEGGRVPVGPALPSCGVYVLDENLKPVPLGWPGELCITGPGISSGYLNQPTLTKSKFVPDRVSKPREKRSLLYRTGDKARMQSDGSLIFLGRVDGDSQIKLRGIRIELDDISNSLLRTSEGTLGDAKVIVKGETNQFLVAFVVFVTGKIPSNKQTYLQKLIQTLPLPVYMRPVLAIPLDSMPFTGRGKLDTLALAALPLPGQNEATDDEEELNEVEYRLKTVWEKVLSEVDIAINIKKSSDFFSVGGNSMLLLRLRAGIRDAFDVDVPLAELFQASTLESLAARLSPGVVNESNMIDWEAESDLPADFSSIKINELSTSAPKAQITVLLTGSTGFLGQGILNQLVNNSKVARIHCVAMRPKLNGQPRSLSIRSPKIVRHAGDLSAPFLGMSEQRSRTLFKEIDIIIHNGAEVSHMKTYRSLRSSNVDSTKELVRLSLYRAVPIHYISTGGVAHLSGKDSQPEGSLFPALPPLDGSDGYVASKWCSERFLEKVNHQFGLPVYIHRPSNITGDNVPEMDIVNNTIKYSRALQAVPDLSKSKGFFDFIHINTISRNIAQAVVDEEIGTNVVYKHQSGETLVPMNGLKSFLAEEQDKSFRILKMAEWVEEAVKMGLNELVASYLLATKGEIFMPLLEKNF